MTTNAGPHGPHPWALCAGLVSRRRVRPTMTTMTSERIHDSAGQVRDRKTPATPMIAGPRPDDPMRQALTAARRDDEPSTSEEDADAAAALAAYQRGEGMSSTQLRAELDLE